MKVHLISGLILTKVAVHGTHAFADKHLVNVLIRSGGKHKA
jgi:hypothetical protein